MATIQIRVYEKNREGLDTIVKRLTAKWGRQATYADAVQYLLKEIERMSDDAEFLEEVHEKLTTGNIIDREMAIKMVGDQASYLRERILEDE